MGQDDLKPDGRSVRLGGEAAGDDDVEGHGARKPAAIDPEGAAGRKLGAVEPEGARRPQATDDDDVEGHRRPA